MCLNQERELWTEPRDNKNVSTFETAPRFEM